MKFIRYNDNKTFGDDVLEILLENEVQNNHMIGFIRNERKHDTTEWLMAAVKDDNGSVLLTAACTPPYNLIIYETKNKPNEQAVKFLSNELKSNNFNLPGVLAKQETAQIFAEIHAEKGRFHRHMSMNIMRLDKVNDIKKADGFCRELCENDMFFIPYWEKEFAVDCRVNVSSIQENVELIKNRLTYCTNYIWENGFPVSFAANHRNTENGAGIGFVYTPPHYRGKGYASSVVSELSQNLLMRGHKFCFLFADANNPISCGMYRKIGFYDLCIFDEIKFEVIN